jgi:23S rRNA U2552 (ribose-2'-O)-methylase RlmE/FtsJ
MVKKLILLINEEQEQEESQSLVSHQEINNVNKLLEQNNMLYNTLKKHKNKITYYHNNKSWDKYKKLGNEYELIFTTANTGTNISSYNPVSRSFFKLWEILYDFDDIIFGEYKNDIRCLFLAEGPGGFAEALIKYRDFKGFTNDNLNGITLKPYHDKNIPEWKINKDIMKKIKISYGEDDTGNLYHFKNINYLVNLYSPNSIEFITADGGFDFSADFNSQEELSFRLILSEVLCAILLQKEGGTFVLKIFDIFNENTMKLIQIITEFYKSLYIIKPLTSRPANSEKYLLCTGFKKTENTKELIDQLISLVSKYSEENLNNVFSKISFKYSILKNLVLYNYYYNLRQIYYIERTINYINYFNEKKNDTLKMNEIMNDHIRKSKKWCEKYNISYINN